MWESGSFERAHRIMNSWLVNGQQTHGQEKMFSSGGGERLGIIVFAVNQTGFLTRGFVQ